MRAVQEWGTNGFLKVMNKCKNFEFLISKKLAIRFDRVHLLIVYQLLNNLVTESN